VHCSRTTAAANIHVLYVMPAAAAAAAAGGGANRKTQPDQLETSGFFTQLSGSSAPSPAMPGADDDDDIGLLSNGGASSSAPSLVLSPLSAKGAWYRVHVSSRLQVLAVKLRPVAGLLLCALAQVFFSIMSLSAKLLGRRLSTAQIVFVRASIQLLIADSLSLWYGVPIWGPKNRRAFLLGRGAAGGVSLTMYYYSLKSMPLGDAVGFSMAQPIWVCILAFIVLKEPVGWKEALMVLVCFCGMLLISKPSFLVSNTEPLPLQGVLAASGAAVLSAVA